MVRLVIILYWLKNNTSLKNINNVFIYANNIYEGAGGSVVG
jgi:hypothetical protein